MIIKDFYKLDVYRLDFEKINEIISLNISNTISWDAFNIKATKEELKGLANFINSYLEEKK